MSRRGSRLDDDLEITICAGARKSVWLGLAKYTLCRTRGLNGYGW
jgi:hypothetical protein